MDAHGFEQARVLLREWRVAVEVFQENPTEKSAHEREAPELQPDPLERIAVRMMCRQDVEGQVHEVHCQGPRTDRQHDFKISLCLHRQQHKERQQEMAEDQKQAYPPPRAVLTNEVPEGFGGHICIPDDEVLRELDVSLEDGERKEQQAQEIKLVVVQHAVEDALALQEHGNEIYRGQGRPGATGEKVHAVNRREPLVLHRLHPKHAGEGQRQREGHHPPPRMITHPLRAQGAAGFILLQRPETQVR